MSSSPTLPPSGPPSQVPPPPPGAPGSVPPPPASFAPTLPPGYQGYQSAELGQLAGFWIRFGSLLIDHVLYGLLLAVFIVPAVAIGASAFDGCRWVDRDFGESAELLCPADKPSGGPLAAAIALGVVGIIVVLVIYVRALGKGQTWGMRITGIKLVHSDNGMPVGFGKALGRSLFASLISANIFYLGYLWAAWDDQKQTWQDKIVSTYVVRT